MKSETNALLELAILLGMIGCFGLWLHFATQPTGTTQCTVTNGYYTFGANTKNTDLTCQNGQKYTNVPSENSPCAVRVGDMVTLEFHTNFVPYIVGDANC